MDGHMLSVVHAGELDWLIADRTGPCVSLFVPLRRWGADVRQNQVRMRRLLRRAREQLVEDGMRRAEVAELLAFGATLVDEVGRWQHPAGGLAAFAAPGAAHWYLLPIEVRELAVVGDRFHLLPLLPLLSGDGRWYVLALSQRRARLLACTRAGVAVLHARRVPAGLAAAMRFDDREDQLQLHTSGQPVAGRRAAAMFHGHGVGADDAKDRILRYFQQVDAGLHPVLARERAPLVLAGVGFLLPLYRRASSYPWLTEAALTGNPDHLTADELRERSEALLAPSFHAARAAAVARYTALAGTGHTVADEAAAAAAARQGGVEVLLCSPTLSADAIASRLVNGTVHDTLRHGGAVHLLDEDELPAARPVAAVLR